MPKDYNNYISSLVCMGLSQIIRKRFTSDALIYMYVYKRYKVIKFYWHGFFKEKFSGGANQCFEK